MRLPSLLRSGRLFSGNEVVVGTEALEGGAVKFLAVVGVCDADDGFRTLLEALSIEVNGSELSYQPVYMVAGRYDTGSGGEDGSDLADALVGD